MSNFDIVLILVLAICAIRGLATGLIKAVGSFVGIIGGAFLASHLYLWLFVQIQTWFGAYANIGKLTSFIIIFIVACWIIRFFFIILDKTYNLLSIIPFLKSINRLAGGILMLLVGGLLIGLLLYVVARYVPANTMVGKWIIDSKIAPALLALANLLLPLISGSLKDIKSIL